MIYIVLFLAVWIYFCFPYIGTAILNIFSVVKNGVKDIYKYIRYKQYNDCPKGQMIAYVGLFGKGKTLSAVKELVRLYNKYNDKMVYDFEKKSFVRQRIVVMSNVEIMPIDCIQLVNLEQIFDMADRRKEIDEKLGTRTVTLVLCDEASTQLNSRNFKTNFNANMLNTLLTCRHHYISFFYTAQRFHHVDALLRQVTQKVIVANKMWRLLGNYTYDAWELENATTPALVKPIKRPVYFVFNRDYEAYNTYACVGNLAKEMLNGDMLSEDEILALQAVEYIGSDVVTKPTRQLKKIRKRK